MKCPQCGNEMVEGNILGDRYNLKYVPCDKNELINDKLLKRGVLKNYILLTSFSSFFSRIKLESHYCSNCRFIIVPIKKL